MTIRLLQGAESDLRSAAQWYDQQRHGLGRDFADQVAAAFARIELDPLSFPIDVDVPRGRDVRWCTVPRFPYRVVFEVRGSVVVVLAIAHHSRRTGYWIRRR